jgi:hypothetical protein
MPAKRLGRKFHQQVPPLTHRPCLRFHILAASSHILAEHRIPRGLAGGLIHSLPTLGLCRLGQERLQVGRRYVVTYHEAPQRILRLRFHLLAFGAAQLQGARLRGAAVGRLKGRGRSAVTPRGPLFMAAGGAG